MRKLVLLGLTIVGNQVHPCSYNGEKRTRLMGRKKVSGLILALALVGTLFVALETKPGLAWSNGGFSTDPSNPDYGTHDWIAQHALDWLPTGEKEYIIDNLALYLYATELPDNGGAPDGIGDVALHHVYYWANESIQDDASAVRAQTEYDNALNYMKSGDVAIAVKTLGIMSHYVVDVGVFGHVMGVGTDWGPEIHHSDYEDYVNTKTNNYTAEFDNYLMFDGTLDNVSAYDATLTLAFNTTFGDSGNYNCTWMDHNYDWNNAEFKNRCGESLNLAVNYLADVLHTLSRALPVHNINTGLGYATIQEAINAANPGDTIFVFNGTYHENIVVDRSVSLVGENKSNTIIDGSGLGSVIYIEGINNSRISGFTIQNGLNLDEGSGIYLRYSSNNIMDGNVIVSNGIGIYVRYDSNNNTIIRNEIKNNGAGIALYYSSNNNLTQNRMVGNFYNLDIEGLSLPHFSHKIDASNTINDKSVRYLVNQKDLQIDNSTFPDIGYLGLVNSTNITMRNLSLANNNGEEALFVFTADSHIEGMNISTHGIGISMVGSNNNTVIHNTLSPCGGGIYLDQSGYNFISNNTVTCIEIGISIAHNMGNIIRNNNVEGNLIGIQLTSTNESQIIDNVITSNAQDGIYITSCENSTIFHNNFINNTRQVFSIDSVTLWDYGYPCGGNYWSDYDDVDLLSGPYQNMTGSDGIGDTSYIINEDNVDDYPLMNPWIAVSPLAVSVSPDSASVHLLQSVTFTSIIVGEAPPYSYQWYLNDSPVSGAASRVWTFALEPSGNYSTGTYSVHLNVTDSMGNSANSNQASVTVMSLFGDLNNDSKVNITDVSEVAKAFGSTPNGPRWDIQADINQDGKVDIKDIASVAKHFGQHYP